LISQYTNSHKLLLPLSVGSVAGFLCVADFLSPAALAPGKNLSGKGEGR